MRPMESPVPGWDDAGSPTDADDLPPPRPRSLAPAELGFTPQDAVRWFSPGVLAISALHVGITSVFGSFLDKRELQSPESCSPDRRYRESGELWFDYVADTGDGFAATATVAHALGRPALELPGAAPLPRGDFLVFGGDEVYPMPESKGYDDRMAGPWKAALPWTDGEHPAAYAIPGNHDWMDGLTGFLRLFAQGGWIGGWKTQQSRSYFALALPHDWWLWGIDIQSDSLIDRPQIDFFTGAAQEAAAAAAPAKPRLVLATATPAWTELTRNPRAYQNLAYLERTVLEPAGVALALIMAGDRHYYARYQGPADGGVPRHLITAGGGGAFLHPTHELRASVAVPASTGDEPGAPPPTTYARAAAYPDRGTSRRRSFQALLLPARNPSFVPAAGLVCLALLWAVQFGLRSLGRRGQSFSSAAAHWGWSDLAAGLFRSFPSLLVLAVLLVALTGFAHPPDWAHRGPRRKAAAKLVMGLAHLGLQVLVMATVLTVTLAAALAWTDGGVAFGVVASVLAFGLGGLACAFTVGLYLTLAVNLPGGIAHANEAFAAARITGGKNFLRLHIDREGRLTVYAVGIDRVVERAAWRADPDAPDRQAPWLVPPEGAPRLHLIEQIPVG
jgi:hypothetical protein